MLMAGPADGSSDAKNKTWKPRFNGPREGLLRLGWKRRPHSLRYARALPLCAEGRMLDSSLGPSGSTCHDGNVCSDLSSSLTSAMEAQNGRSLSEYRIEGKIGTGKFSTVYAAWHIAAGQPVALKTVQVFEILDSKLRMDCIKEVNMLRALEHKNIIKYLDSFVHDNELVIVLEWARGGDLGSLLKERRQAGQAFSEADIWGMFTNICAALNHMHERRIMHRDIKPSNMFVSSEGIKVGDLGLSRYFSSRTAEAHSVVGTPYYMSPECIRGLPYDWSSDIWSLGCLLYEMITLRSPFYMDGLNFYTLGKKITNCEYPPLPDSVPTNLKLLVYSMLHVNPQSRPSLPVLYQAALAGSQGADLMAWTNGERLVVPGQPTKEGGEGVEAN